MIVRTSFWEKEKENGYENCLAVSIGVPKDYAGEKLPSVMPTWRMVKMGYGKEEYFSLLECRKCDARAILEACDGKILCCWEKKPSACHRQMLIEWLKNKVAFEYIPEETIPGNDRADDKTS